MKILYILSSRSIGIQTTLNPCTFRPSEVSVNEGQVILILLDRPKIQEKRKYAPQYKVTCIFRATDRAIIQGKVILSLGVQRPR